MSKSQALFTARLLTQVLSPLLIPFYAVVWLMMCTYLQLLPVPYKLFVFLMALVFITILPAIILMTYRHINHWDNRQLLIRQNRTVPYICITLCYYLCHSLLVQANSPHLLITIPLTAMALLILTIILNLRWKLSTHLIALGAIQGGYAAYGLLFSFQPFWGLILLTLIAGLLASAQRRLRQHSNLQLLVSYVIGIIVAYFITLL